jgi:hypothetical protein
MNCFEDSVREITGHDCPPLGDDDAWAQRLQAWLGERGFVARFEVRDDVPLIVSRRLPNGKVHAEVMHPTLITTIARSA